MTLSMFTPQETAVLSKLPPRLRLEAVKRRAAVKNTTPFVDFVSRVNPRYKWYKANKVLASVLQRVADGELKRVMIFMHPRSGKSELVSRLFTPYYLTRHPEQWVGLNSYGAELAYTLSRNARDNYTTNGAAQSDNAYAVKQWETGKGGGLWAESARARGW